MVLIKRAIVAAILGIVFLGIAAADAQANIIEQSYPIEVKCTSQGELCEPAASVLVETGSALQVKYTQPIPNDGCSPIKLHIYVDGVSKRDTELLGWPGATGEFKYAPLNTDFIDLGPVSPGRHIVSLQAEGYPVGCNNGYLAIWGGTLVVKTSPLVQISDKNLVTNGDFEVPKVTDYYHYACYRADQIEGWKIIQASENKDGSACIELMENEEGTPSLKEWAIGYWKAAKGFQWAELDGDSPVRIYQDLQTTPGATYELSFAFSPRPAEADNRLEVKWAGSTIDVVSADGSNKTNTDWEYYVYNVTTTYSSTRLEFVDLSTSDGLGTFLDDVDVKLVPTGLESQAPILLASTWTVREWSSQSNYVGTYIRRPGTNTFDASWNYGSEGSVNDVIDITSVQGNEIILHRRGLNGDYTGIISPDGKSISGTASWYGGPGAQWSASIPT